MKTRAAIILSLSLGLLSANTAMANDAVLGAIVGGGLGAVVGNHVGGRDGAVIGGAVGAAAGVVIAADDDPRHRRSGYGCAPPPVRVYAQLRFTPGSGVFIRTGLLRPPARVVHPTVVYVPAHPSKKDWRHDRHHRHDRDDRRDHYWR